MTTTDVVAVKIIDIDESDTADPRNADSYGEFLKEINALKVLREHKARNINHVVDALSIGKTVWIITEYCGGGSVATLVCVHLSFGISIDPDTNIIDETDFSRWPVREMDHSNSTRSCRST